jgi:hypothetical protein
MQFVAAADHAVNVPHEPVTSNPNEPDPLPGDSCVWAYHIESRAPPAGKTKVWSACPQLPHSPEKIWQAHAPHATTLIEPEQPGPHVQQHEPGVVHPVSGAGATTVMQGSCEQPLPHGWLLKFQQLREPCSKSPLQMHAFAGVGEQTGAAKAPDGM